jgi:hypothetical protein
LFIVSLFFLTFIGERHLTLDVDNRAEKQTSLSISPAPIYKRNCDCESL